jgi:hypothetical protein
MQKIHGQNKTINNLLDKRKYAIDYYQREYRWTTKQVRELIQDLTEKFLEDYTPGDERLAVEGYGHYYLGTVILSHKDGRDFIVDGQQRLTTLTLLLTYMHNLQAERDDIVPVDGLICSVKFGQKSFNINVPERTPCMETLFDGEEYDPSEATESVQNIVARYGDIVELFPDEIDQKALPYFIDWLLENVHLVEITAFSDSDAYTIFETTNDRGLSLTATEMLKGYLLANITNSEAKTQANELWKNRILQLKDEGKDADADFFKAWLRSQYAKTIRERKRGAKPQEFDVIGTEFHRFVRDERKRLKLNGSQSYLNFIKTDFDFYSKQYLRLMQAGQTLQDGLEHVYYNANHGFTLQYMLLLAPLLPTDNSDSVRLKVRLVARYLDILINRRIWNFKSTTYSTMQYTMFNLMKEVRGLAPVPLANLLEEKLVSDTETTFATNDRLYRHQQNRWALHRILARLTDYIEQQSGMGTHYDEFINAKGDARYEVEHIWADHPERHMDEFEHVNDFSGYRNRIGGLVLLPKQFNASYGDLPYAEKMPKYYSQNMLARTLNPKCYESHPEFLRFVSRSGLPFRPHEQFKKDDLDERQTLYRLLAEQVWDPTNLIEQVAR